MKQVNDMKYLIRNVSEIKRHCHNLLIEAGMDEKTSDEQVVSMARLSPQIFEVEEVNEPTEVNE